MSADRTTGRPAELGSDGHRPDVLLVMTDQHRAGFTAAGGFPLDTMPFLDDLGRRGAVFDNAYTSYPACVPARTSLLTGRFPSAHCVRQNSTPAHASYDEDLLDVLRAAGYSLHFVGKPHMHRGAQDFDTFSGPYMHTGGPQHGVSGSEAAFDDWLEGLDHGVAEEPTPFPVEAQLPHRIVTDALDVLGRDRELLSDGSGRPRFLWVSFPEPHNPYQVPEPYFSAFTEEQVPDRRSGPEAASAKGGAYTWLRDLVEEKRPGYDDGWRRYRANYLGMLRFLDDQIRRLVDGLGEQASDTVILFVSDHGDYVGEYGLQRKGAGLPECLLRIPFQITGPGVVPGRRRELVSMVDLMPTIAEIVGADLPAGTQGRGLLPLLQGGAGPVEEFGTMFAEVGYGGVPYDSDDRPELHFPYEGRQFDELNSVTHSGGQRMVREGRWKLLLDARGRLELYDIEQDPAELRDLAGRDDLAAVRERLLLVLGRWSIRVTDDLPTGAYRPRTVPHNWRWALQEDASEETPTHVVAEMEEVR